MVRLHGRIRMPERRDISIKQVFCYSQVLISLFAAYINDFPFSFVNRLSLIIYQFHFRNAGLIILCVGRQSLYTEVAKSSRNR